MTDTRSSAEQGRPPDAPANRQQSEADRERTAYHEAGHAVVGFFRREGGSPVGVTMHAADLAAYNGARPPDRHVAGFYARSATLPPVVRGRVDAVAVHATLAMMLGGLAADLVQAGRPLAPFASLRDATWLSGARGDLANAIALADRALVVERDDLMRAAMAEAAETSDPAEAIARRSYRAHLGAHVYPMLDAALADAHAIVTEHWPAVCRVARALLERGRLDGAEIAELIEGDADA